MVPEVSRRGVLAGGALAGLPLAGCAGGPPFPGALLGPDSARGHLLRDGAARLAAQASAMPAQRVGLMIAGGGVAGLAAGWRLAQAGYRDFVLLELEDEPGGNARAGRNAATAFPWGAHYLPVPGREAGALRHMLAQFGIITGHDASGAPIYDPAQLTADLEERLLWRGSWQEGLYPTTDLTDEDKAQHRRFFAAMAAFRAAHGHDGRPVFASPIAFSSQDPAYTALDNESFAQWLARHAYRSAPLLAHIRYACRDDYGCEPGAISAWAGLHYFAGRRGWAADGAGDNQLTWPEGNARLTRAMAASIAGHIRPGHSLLRAQPQAGGVALVGLDHQRQALRHWQAQGAILAMPDFVARHVAPGQAPMPTASYAPWVVANVALSRRPGGPGVPLAWDNVSATSASLGYVVANHQTSSAPDGPCVVTWYTALSQGDPVAARRDLAGADLARWQNTVAQDLLAANPDLEGAIERIDVWRWAHAMVRPVPGFLRDAGRLAAQASPGPIWRAHSDISGLSLFEEAHYRGVAAAEAAMARLGHPFESVLT